MEINNLKPSFDFVSVESIKEPERYLKEPAEILSKLGVKWCLGFGTAIGLYRDGDFPKQDTDVDIMVYDGDPKQIEDALKEKYALIRTIDHEGKRQQTAFQGEDGYIVDISHYYQENDCYVSRHEEGIYSDKCAVIGDFMALDTKYGTFPLPQQIETYLEVRYGDWRTPRYGSTTSAKHE